MSKLRTNKNNRDGIDEKQPAPTKRMNAAYAKKMSRRFEMATRVFAASTVAILLSLVLAIGLAQEMIFNVGLGVVFLVWLPSLIIGAFNAKYYDPWGLNELCAKNDSSWIIE